ncbi:hypothetical protein CROQUDRAFT_671220 [Cronartium quercuum f. sp. fusiforme G11]|uniref:Proteophosphoglycan ppg4 n=1 Tax=Cronartium quercuum f. sp. fusiforme G11 TaxID=708437 RepID=A0A9P6NMS7_9BASI|nr:hypothetical protein CROQUDRAFT_671220 [Cronartium quercuum f. sp. fusiforme G11]
MPAALSPRLAGAFSPSRLAFADPWAPSSDQAIIEAGSSTVSSSSSLLCTSLGEGACRSSVSSWLEPSERDSGKTQRIAAAAQLCTLSAVNEHNPMSSLSPTCPSFGPSREPSVHSAPTSMADPLASRDLSPPSPSAFEPAPAHTPEVSSDYLRDAISTPLALPPPLDRWDQSAFSLSVAFTGALYRSQLEDEAEADGTAPPAFFPLQRVGFSPQLKVHSSSAGLPLSLVGGMTLGVTGVVSVPMLDRTTGRQVRDSRTGGRKWRTQRIVVDFVTDLSHGLETWKADAEFATMAAGGSLSTLNGQGILPPGTYILPLSMKIPASEKLPPSFTCDSFRITYTMSLALWSRATDVSTGQPVHCKVFTIPFDILPATLPTAAPKLPRLVWEDRSMNGASAWGGMWEGLKRAISLGRPEGMGVGGSGSSESTAHSRKRAIAAITAQMHGAQAAAAAAAASTATHVVIPTLPSSSFSPASLATIPITISIIDRPLVPTDLYVRVSLLRSIYVRDSKRDWLSEASELLLTDEAMLANHLKEEKEISSRWGYIPYHLRPHADPMEECEVLIRDLAMPLITEGELGWSHGYSTALELEPTPAPVLDHHPVSGSSWFSPAFRRRAPVEKEYGRHLHVSTRFSIALEVGFARVPEGSQDGILAGTLAEVQSVLGNEFQIPAPHTFTKASVPKTSSVTGGSLTNPFPAERPGHRHHHSLPANLAPVASSSTFAPPPSLLHLSGQASTSVFPNARRAPGFPGKIRTLRCPIVIGSVAEPNLACLVVPEAERRLASDSARALQPDAQRRAEEEEDMRRAVEAAEPSIGGDGEAWVCAPPDYAASLKGPPAYV